MNCSSVENRAPHSNSIASRGCGQATTSGVQNHAPRCAYEAMTRPPARASTIITGDAQAPRGELSLSDPRAQKAIATSLRALGGCAMGEAAYKATRVEVDDLGMAHVRLDRLHHGIRVFGEQVLTHMRSGPGGEVTDVTNFNALLPRDLAIKPSMSKQEAERAACTVFGAEPLDEPQVERVYFAAGDGSYRLGFFVRLQNLRANPPRSMSYLVDASSKQIVRQWSNLCTGFSPTPHRAATPPSVPPTPSEPAPGTEPAPDSEPDSGLRADDDSLYYGKVALSDTTEQDGQHILLDKSRGAGLHSKDAQNYWDRSKAVELTDDDGAWGEKADSPRHKGVVDMHWAMQLGYDYLKSLGINSFDLKGGPVTAFAHLRTNYINAYYARDTVKNEVNYSCGDGDGRMAGPLTEITVVDHELHHAVDDFATDGGLTYVGESGGLNEAYADIGAHLVLSFAAKMFPGQIKSSWKIGEACWTPKIPGDALRYMDEPSRDGYSVDHYSRYPNHDEVHQSSGIANAMFYQLCEPNNEGKKPNSVSKLVVKDGIGEDKGALIYYRALRFYTAKDCSFAGARVAWIKAATDLFGADSVEVKKVKEAWTAVGVEDPGHVDAQSGAVATAQMVRPGILMSEPRATSIAS